MRAGCQQLLLGCLQDVCRHSSGIRGRTACGNAIHCDFSASKEAERNSNAAGNRLALELTGRSFHFHLASTHSCHFTFFFYFGLPLSSPHNSARSKFLKCEFFSSLLFQLVYRPKILRVTFKVNPLELIHVCVFSIW